MKALLMGTRPDVKLHRHGVQIKGACIDERVDLENAQIPCEVRLEHCQFNATVTFDSASFAGYVSFANSTFKADAYFNSVKVGSTAVFNGAVFEASLDFSRAKVWTPKADQTFLRNYMRVHIMLGWILVPLVLAALTGLIK
jgi:Pentapeptide repeats (9 copies)